MLYFSLQDNNTVVFYTPTKLNLVAGEQLSIDFVAEYSLESYSITSSIVSYNGPYIKFVIPSASNVYDTDRGWVYEFVPSNIYTSSFESASYYTHSINITEYVYTSSFETASYYTASIPGDGGTPYISVRETATYYVYNG